MRFPSPSFNSSLQMNYTLYLSIDCNFKQKLLIFIRFKKYKEETTKHTEVVKNKENYILQLKKIIRVPLSNQNSLLLLLLFKIFI